MTLVAIAFMVGAAKHGCSYGAETNHADSHTGGTQRQVWHCQLLFFSGVVCGSSPFLRSDGLNQLQKRQLAKGRLAVAGAAERTLCFD
jgi:hypothetical protein